MVKCGVAIIIFIRGLKDWVASYLFIRVVGCEVEGSLFMQGCFGCMYVIWPKGIFGSVGLLGQSLGLTRGL